MKWSDHDLKVLAEHYPTGGSRAVIPRLEVKRKPPAVGQMARKMGLGMSIEYTRQEMTPQVLRALKAEYAKPGGPDLVALEKRVGRKRGWLRWQAQRYGLVRGRKAVWTDEAESILAELEGMGLNAMYKRLKIAGYGYTRSQLATKVQLMGLTRVNESVMTANAVARILDVDVHAVMRWIRTGALAAKRRKNMDGDGQAWEITPGAFRDFVLNYTSEIDLRRVQPAYQSLFIDLVAGGNRAGRVAA